MKDIRHSDRRCYVKEGHGGQAIEAWPIHRFFHGYLNGSPDQAAAEFADWYYEQFMRYRHVSKRLGGMRGGSLARTLETTAGDVPDVEQLQDTESFEPAIEWSVVLHEAIAVRVKQRFELLDSIREFGYVTDRKDPVIGIQKGRCIQLEGGHHRAAALKVLGWSVVPGVLLFPSPLIYHLWLWYRRFAHAAVSLEHKP